MVEGDPEAFNCDTCPVRQRQEALDGPSRRALDIWSRLNRRFVSEHHVGAWLLAHETADWTADERVDLIERLALIFDVLAPPAEDTA